MKNLKTTWQLDENDISEIIKYIEPSVIHIVSDNSVIYNPFTKFLNKYNFDKSDYLSFCMLEDGDFERKGTTKTIEYSLNDREWIEYSSKITCHAGDILKLRGNNTSYSGTQLYYSGYHIIYGNTDSLINSDESQGFTVSSYSNNVFTELFKNDNTLLSIKNLNINANSSSCCYGMFQNCTALLDVLDFLPTPNGNAAFYNMFYNCIKINNSNNLTINVKGTSCCYSMFYNCTNMQSVPKLNQVEYAGSMFREMFKGCSSLKSVYSTINLSTGYPDMCRSMFADCTNLTTPTKLIGTVGSSTCNNMFSNCTSLNFTEDEARNYFSEVKIPNNNSVSACFAWMFKGCTSLTKAPDLPSAVSPASYCYEFMFQDCINLEEVPTIIYSSVKSYSMYMMFSGCTKLKKADILILQTVRNCFAGMFSGCKNLNDLSVFTFTKGANNLSNTDWLLNVSPTGNIMVLDDSIQYIPEGWTITPVSLDYAFSLFGASYYNGEINPLDLPTTAEDWYDWCLQSINNGNKYIITDNGKSYTLFINEETQTIYAKDKDENNVRLVQINSSNDYVLYSTINPIYYFNKNEDLNLLSSLFYIID